MSGGGPVEIKFSGNLQRCDPRKHPVTILGRLDHIRELPYEQVKCKMEPRVSEEIYSAAIKNLEGAEWCPLYLNLARIAVLPRTMSRNNTPSNSHTITRHVQKFSACVDEYFVIICEKTNVFASACAVARAFPLVSWKSCQNCGHNGQVVTVEFIIVGETAGSCNTLSEQEIALLEHAAFAVRNTARIIDMPCNEMNTTQLVKECEKIAGLLDIKATVIRGEDLLMGGFEGIYSVGKAAEHPPALVILSHLPKNGSKHIAWVGKGIVFDTGGLSIKGKTGIQGMKRDCGGAAAILNAFYLAVKAGFKENLHALLCIAENAVGPLSVRPDDILTMYSKKTVEINNTDAEGRLVLSDGVAYAKSVLKADIIIDMATLTGAQGVATGKFHAAILTSDEDWEQAFVKAGKTSGDLTFPIIFAPEFHFTEFKSSVADMKNSVANRSNALASCAGLFIQSHLGNDFTGVWVHVDIASPSHFGDNRGTGFGSALLNVAFGHLSSNPLLRSLSPW